MVASRPLAGPARSLAAEIGVHEVSQGTLEHRLGLARRVVADAQRSERLHAGLVVGSTALRRCGPRADLDIVLILDGPSDHPPFESRDIEGVHVEIERLPHHDAVSLAMSDGWTWELRAASRLGCGLPVFDPHGFATRMRNQAAAQQPDAQCWESTLRDVYLSLCVLGNTAALGTVHGETLRSVFDKLTLLTLLRGPRRYQKPKWALADLIHAGHASLCEAVLNCYGIRSNSVKATAAAIGRSKALVAALYAATCVPTHATLLAMAHAPQFAEASYVSRTLDDAEELAASGCQLQAQYVAKLAARLAAALVSSPDSSGSLLDGLQALDASLASLYRDVFADAPVPRRWQLQQALACADFLLAETAPASRRNAARISA